MMQVSANITSILESLLKDYDKTERPSYPYGESSTQISPVSTNIYYLCTGKPTEVKVNILIRSMGPISEMQMVRKQSREMMTFRPVRYFQYIYYYIFRTVRYIFNTDQIFSVLLNGLLLSPVLEGPEAQLQGAEKQRQQSRH